MGLIRICRKRTKHPNVTRRGESTEVYGFGSHPFDGQYSFRCLVITLLFNPSTESKIGQFDAIMRRNQNVAGSNVSANFFKNLFNHSAPDVTNCEGNVPMNEFLGLEVGESSAQLMCKED